MQPNVNYLRQAKAFGEVYEAHNEDNMGQFKAVWTNVLAIEKDSRTAEIKEMKRACGTIHLESAKREYRRLLDMAKNYSLLPDRYINLSAISFDNLKSVLSLSARVEKYYDNKQEEKLQQLSTVWVTGMSATAYNNALEKRIRFLKAMLPAVVEKKVIESEEALTLTDNMAISAKRAVLDRLLEEFGLDAITTLSVA